MKPNMYASYNSDTDTDTDSDLDVGEDDRKELVKPVQFGLPPDTLTYVPYAPPQYELKKPTTTTPPDTVTSQQTSVIVINSKDRDRTVYPDPTFFTLRLPRIYRNIKSINLTEISILNSFFNFRADKGNITLPLIESGRSTFSINIRQGTYTSDSLVSELQSALNKTPLFANISFTAFKNQFKATGNFNLLFNQPNGEIFNYQTNQYDTATTTSQISAQYFQQQETFGISNFTNQQCAVAYYYPCMKQMILQNIPFDLHTDYYNTLQPESTLYPNPTDYILFGFQGLNDRYITFLSSDPATSNPNITLFQSFHDANTFLQFPVNQYTCIYNNQSGRFQITAPNINTSISADIISQYNIILNQLAYDYGYNGSADLTINLNTNTLLKQVRLEFYNFIQKQFSDVFGIDFGTYTSDFFINTNNEMILYNTKNKVGWITDSNFIPDVLISTFPLKLPDVPVHWPNLQFTYSTITDGISTVTFYSTIGMGINLDANGYIQFSNASEHQNGYFDIPFDIAPTNYARLLFQSKMRQTIQLMTIPRYSTNRTSTNGEIYKFGSTISETPFLFLTDGTILIDQYTNPTYIIYAIQHVLFKTPDYMRFNGTEWLLYVNEVNPVLQTIPPSINDIKVASFQPYILFEVNAAEMLVMPDATFNIDIYVETQDGANFPVPITLSWYRDRSAFMADVNQIYQGNYTQNPYYYFVNETFENTNSASITCKTLSAESSYLLVTTASPNSPLPGNLPLRVFAVSTDIMSISTITHAQLLDTRKLPWSSTAIERVNPINSQFQDPLTSIFSTATDFFQLGYDNYNISNNLMDWMVQGTNNIFYDPNSITTFSTTTYNGLQYIFQKLSDASATPDPQITNWNLFFPIGTSNTIANTYIRENYNTSSFTIANGTSNEFTLVNWFNSANTKESFWKPRPFGNSNYLIDCSTILSGVGVFQACVNPSYNLQADMSTNSGAYDSNGLSGLSFFLPPGEVVSLQEVVLKFGYTSPTFRTPAAITPITRNSLYATSSSFPSQTSLAITNSFYSPQSCDPDVQTEFASWDDWYLPNRRNLRIGVYPTAQISSISISSLVIESSICTLSLNKVTQVNNYTYSQTSIRTRQPEWGTYYTYMVNPVDRVLWAPSTITMYGTANNWTSTLVGADLVPTYESSLTSNEGYFKTEPNINNYNGIERNYGLAPSVGFTVNTPYSTISNWVSDIPNSYTMVPFYWSTNKWVVGSWFGLTFTTTPQLPSASTLGASPYYGPPGFMGWTTTSGTMKLASTGMTSFKPVYWNAKISFNQMNDGYEPQNDINAFGGVAGLSGELQDTRMFFYQNLTAGKDLDDIYIPTTGYYVYGAEKADNYTARDDNSGYNYLSFLPDLTIRSSLEASTCEYAVHVRGQVPTVQFTTGLRVIGKNYTDFGTVQINELLNEISSLSRYVPIGPTAAYSFVTSNTAIINQSTYTYQNLLNKNNSIRYNSSIGNYFSFDYADSLITFDKLFSVGTISFGVNAASGYPGVTFSFYNFSTALSSYIGFFNANFANFSTIIGIYAEANMQLGNYISTSYNGVLPPQFITRARYTDPLTFSLPFSTTLVTPYNTAVDEWGLGWNLGFAKKDTSFAVSQTSETFIRIVADYLYLQLNESYNMNGISVTEPENLSLTRDAMGQNQRYFAKILLNDFGSISRTAVQMPKEFSPAANKFDTFSFQLVDKMGRPVVNTDCDSDLTLQIVEERIDLKIDTHPAQNVIR